MTTVVSQVSGGPVAASTSRRANALADRLEYGACALEDVADAHTEEEWRTRIAGDGRTVGVVVHHVATMYPLEIQLAQTLASGKPITGVTSNTVHELKLWGRQSFYRAFSIVNGGRARETELFEGVGR